MSENNAQQFDSWDDDLRDHQKSRYKAGGKKFGYFWKLSESPVRFHPVLPTKLYVHPKSKRQHPFRTGFRHFIPGRGKNGGGLYTECNYGREGDPCIVHAYSHPELYELSNVRPDAGLASCKEAPYFAIGGFIEEDFHLVQETVDGKEVRKRVLCTGRGCEECKKSTPVVFGKKAYLEMSPAQWQHSFHPISKQIENHFCACGGDLFVSGFLCSSCNELVLDVSTHCDRCQSQNITIDVGTKQAKCLDCQRVWSAVYTDHKQLYEDSLQPYLCKKCKHEGFLVADRFCSVEGCKGIPMSIFDSQLTLHKSGEGVKSRVFVDTYSVQPLDERLFLPEYQGNDELASKVVEAHKKPLDLEYLLQAKSIEDQCQELGKPNPFTADSRGSQRYVKYEGENTGRQSSEG